MMASNEHKQLADFIKKTHQELRKLSLKLGTDTAWKQHCENEELLSKYAKSMEALATKHWDINAANETKCLTSRISWAVNFIIDYFNSEKYLQFRLREEEISSKLDILTKNCYSEFTTPLKLLDVGSCYNPFKSYNFLNVLAIDIAPANEYVLKSDFLSLKVSNVNLIENRELKVIRKESFDVVTFCFLLEYLPSLEQRNLACIKAYNILKFEGLLIICSPDSKHVGANAKVMKNWRYALARIGFSRIKYEKFTHMHCLAFRKSINQAIASRWATIHESDGLINEIAIPQDSNTREDEINYTHKNRKDDFIVDFSCLPGTDVFD